MLQNVDPSTMLFDAAVATIGSAFETVEVFKAEGNYVILAHQGPPKPDAALAGRAAALDAAFAPRYPLAELVKGRQTPQVEGGQVLTDDFAPVEALKATQKHNRPGFPQQ